MPKTKPLYFVEFKLEAVRLVKESGRRISDVVRDLGVTGESSRNWIRQHEIDVESAKGLSTSECEELQTINDKTLKNIEGEIIDQ